jgi:hypothetical protein
LSRFTEYKSYLEVADKQLFNNFGIEGKVVSMFAVKVGRIGGGGVEI